MLNISITASGITAITDEDIDGDEFQQHWRDHVAPMLPDRALHLDDYTFDGTTHTFVWSFAVITVRPLELVK